MIQPIGHRPKPGAVDRGHHRHAGRHAEDQDRDQQGAGEPEQGRQMGLHLEDADGTQQHDHRHGGQDRRQQHAAGRIVELRPDLRFHSILPVRGLRLWRVAPPPARDVMSRSALRGRPGRCYRPASVMTNAASTRPTPPRRFPRHGFVVADARLAGRSRRYRSRRQHTPAFALLADAPLY